MMTPDSHKFKNWVLNYQNIVSICVIADALYKKIPALTQDGRAEKARRRRTLILNRKSANRLPEFKGQVNLLFDIINFQNKA
ncbi:hypothetical protein [Kosakonia radicincitans]|uniref:hypothetical protein n=1 Tax=Kosakonia radicincitans TaxID=283686 RepID=UPI000A6A4CAC|nr:hypothetical protein [Kosakonia radicincitans]